MRPSPDRISSKDRSGGLREYPDLGYLQRTCTFARVSRRLPTPLSIALLHRIAREGLPLILTDEPDVEAASELVIAGHLKGTVQVVLDPRGGGPQAGLVARTAAQGPEQTYADLSSTPQSGRRPTKHQLAAQGGRARRMG